MLSTTRIFDRYTKNDESTAILHRVPVAYLPKIADIFKGEYRFRYYGLTNRVVRKSAATSFSVYFR